MIDISKAKIFYKEYIKNFDTNNPKIALKTAHIYRTADRAREIAEDLKLSEEDVKLAELIALLHDIGRFEQIKRYNTFIDSNSVNHAELGVKILFDDGLIRNFIIDTSYYEIIYKSIINHNKDMDKIQDGLTDRELLHVKIIRDADKLDIFYVLLTQDIETIYDGGNILTNPITKEVFDEYINNHRVNYKHLKRGYDLLIAHIAYVYDINFDYTLKKIKENEYIEKLLKRFEFRNIILKEQVDIAYKQAKDYISSRGIKC